MALFAAEFHIFSIEPNVSAKSVLHIKHPQITQIELAQGNLANQGRSLP